MRKTSGCANIFGNLEVEPSWTPKESWLYGKNGLAEADESVLFDCRLQLAREACRKFAPAFERHFDECIVLRQPSVPEAAAAAILVL